MVPLLVEEVVMFDVLAVLEIKILNCQDPTIKYKLKEQKLELQKQISLNIGREKAVWLYTTEEYRKLFNANLVIFNAIELAKQDKITAKQLDNLNYQRYLAKKGFQEKHFKNKIEEIKLGY